jgi:hypothetical protein
VAQAPVGPNLYEASDILIDFPAQIALGDVFPVDYFPNPVYLLLGQLVHAGRHYRVQVCLGQNFRSEYRADAVDTAQGHVGPLTVRHVYASDTNHYQPPEMTGSTPAAGRVCRWNKLPGPPLFA